VIESLGKGGAEQALLNLLPSLQKKGVTCHVAVLWPPYDLVKQFEVAGIVVHRLGISNRWNVVQAIGRLVRLCKLNHYDFVHAHLFFAGLYTALSKLFVRVPKRVVSFHNLDYDSYPANTWWKKTRKFIDHLCMRYLMDGATAVSVQVKDHYEHHLSLQGLEVIPNSIPTPFPAETIDSIAIQEFLTNTNKQFMFAMPGRLVHEKGHCFALAAMRLLLDEGCNVRLIIIGDGPLHVAISEEILELGLSDSVFLHPAIEQRQLFAALKAVDACLFASTHEGWGLAAAEAMALGKPVIATKVGGFMGIIENGASGLLVEPASPDVLAHVMRQMMDNRKLCEKLAEAGKESVEKRFNPTSVANSWHSFYQGMLK